MVERSCEDAAMPVDTSLALRAALIQALGVLVLAVALGLALPHSFFEDWGWLAGPAAWMLAALATALILRLPLVRTLCGAALAGMPSALATLAGLHWLGAALAIVLFALWCGGPAARSLTGRTA
jgi:hypothetical protein